MQVLLAVAGGFVMFGLMAWFVIGGAL